MAVGLTMEKGFVEAVLYASEDGISWERRVCPVQAGLLSAAAGDEGVVCIGENLVLAGGSWDSLEAAQMWSSRSTSGISGAACIAGRYVLIVLNYQNRTYVLTSPDGESWAPLPYEATHGGTLGRFFDIEGRTASFGWVEDCGGVLWTSADGLRWDYECGLSLPGFFQIESVVFGNGSFVMVGGSGRLATSADGLRWTEHATDIDSSHTFVSVVYAFGRFLASTYQGEVIWSADGTAWHKEKKASSLGLSMMAYGDGILVAAGGWGLYRSTDGKRWTRTATDCAGRLFFREGRFVYLGPEYTLTSPDGQEWAWETSLEGGLWRYSLAAGPSGFVTPNPDGGILLGRCAVPRPVVKTMTWGNGPFQIMVRGHSFGQGTRVSIGGVPWTGKLKVKGREHLVIRGGSALKEAVPRDTPTEFLFTNPGSEPFRVVWQWP